MDSREKENSSEEMSISEIADILHLSQSTLRYYEEEGLVHPLRSENSGYRRYSKLSLAELTDVVLYRSFGVPVKEIGRLMNAPIEETVYAIDQALDNTVENLKQLSQTLEMLARYNHRIRRFFSLRSRDRRIVDSPGIKHLYPFGMKDKASIQSYLENPQKASYGVFFKSASQPEDYVDGAISPSGETDERPIWTEKDGSRYLECLLRTDYCFTERNNLSEHVEYMKDNGMEPGFVAAEYLTFDYSEEHKKRYDYYLAWIQIL